MSKERELLKEVMSHFAAGEVTVSNGNFGVLAATLYKIQELLAQPEQEPVGIVITIGGYPDDSYHTVKLTCRHRDLKNGDLLYTTPPKREPLSKEAIMVNFDLDRMKEAIECPTIDLEEFRIMVEKGTAAWKDVPDDWLEDLRGNNDD